MSQSIYNPITKQLETFAGNQEAIAAKLNGLADVVAPNPSNNDLLSFDAVNSQWKPTAKPRYTALEVGTYSKDEIDELFAEHENNVTWKAAVATYDDIATTYPNPQEGWTVVTTDTNISWRYSGGQWVKISANTIPLASATNDGLMSTTDFNKLSGVAAGAQVNQNAFSVFKIGNTTIAADNATDVLELIAGTKITITPDETNDTITISADEEPYQVMSVAEIQAGTSEAARSMTAKNLKEGLAGLYLNMIYPVGSIYMSTKNVSPATFIGGTWRALSGYMLRAATSNVTFDTNTKTGGADSVSYTPKGSNSGGSVGNTTLTVNQIPAHTHTQASCTNPGNHSHGLNSYQEYNGGGSAYRTFAYSSSNAVSSAATGAAGGHTHTITLNNTGGGGAHNHGFTNPTFTGTAATINTLPNYRNVYMWERTE
ncbi:MAG: hypothetical protein J6Y86_07460 [Pseudobutyrivibrio sp.]|nr:hypothetical protein [Pseudobutyrivibrio sp.]